MNPLPVKKHNGKGSTRPYLSVMLAGRELAEPGAAATGCVA